MGDKFSKPQILRDLRDYEYETKLVQYFEQSDNPNLKHSLSLSGSIAKITLAGYLGLIKSFVHEHEGEHKELKEFALALEQNLESLNDRGNFAEKIYHDLETKGSAYSNYISHGGDHANFLKFFKKDGAYYCTIYNAGAYIDSEQREIATHGFNNASRKDGQYLTYPSVTYQMKEEHGIQKIVTELVTESGKFTNEEISKRNKVRFVSSERVSSKQTVQTQRVGNCSTRSIREALRENIPTASFRELYDFINHTPYSTMLLNFGEDSEPASPKYKLPASMSDVMEIIEEKLRSNHGLSSKELIARRLDLIAVEVNKDKNIRSFLHSNDGVEFVTSALARDIANARIVTTNNKHTVKIDLTDFKFYGRGFNSITKKLLIDNTASDFAKDHKLDSELTKKLWHKMFEASIQDIDLPLTKDLLAPVGRHLAKIMGRHKKLGDGNFDKILQNWQLSTLSNYKEKRSLIEKVTNWIQHVIDPKKESVLNTRFSHFLENFAQSFAHNTGVDPMVKAPILKGLLDGNKTSDRKLKVENKAVDYYLMLQKSSHIHQNIDPNIKKYMSVKTQAPPSSPNFHRSKIALEKKLNPKKGRP
jgi:hypothetical protein